MLYKFIALSLKLPYVSTTNEDYIYKEDTDDDNGDVELDRDNEKIAPIKERPDLWSKKINKQHQVTANLLILTKKVMYIHCSLLIAKNFGVCSWRSDCCSLLKGRKRGRMKFTRIPEEGKGITCSYQAFKDKQKCSK